MTVMLVAGKLSAQVSPRRQTQQALPPPLPLRQVSGIVKDTTDTTLPGAVIKLQSAQDTLSTAANMDGVFIFKNVKSATFVLTVTSIGYRPLVKKFLNNDAVPRLTLDPLILKSASTQLKTVIINGTPSIVYKTDTVEYRASDYKVRPNATLDELLKKMEGFEVGSDGSVTHQGQAITKVKLNGKDYAGGDVAQAIQNLPAEIIEKAQVVDDYGDQAARTGIKDGDPQKILNVTTRADRSVGTTGRLTTQAGNDDRYNAKLFVQRINGNEQLGIIGRLANTQNGVASSGIGGGATNGGGGGSGTGAGARGGGSPGTTLSGSPTFNYRDQWSKKLQVIGSYSYNFRDNNSTNNSYGKRVSTLGPSFFTKDNTAQSDSKGHNFDMEFDYQIDSTNYLQIRPSFSYSSSSSNVNGTTDLQNHYIVKGDTTFQHQFNTADNSNTSSSPKFATSLLYVHNFKKPRRVVSLNANINTGPSHQNGDKNNLYQYYKDSTLTSHIPGQDSLSHLLTNRSSNNTSFRASVTYSEPVGQYGRFEFNGQTNISSTHNIALSDSIGLNGQTHHIANLDNIFNTVATEERLAVAYSYNGTKLAYKFGTQFIPRLLRGDKIDNSNTGQNVETSRSDFKIIPVLRASYSWSRTQRLSFTYSGTNQEPNFTQIQPFTDRTDPNNIIVGNPNLNQTFTNSYNLVYNNYFPNSRFNISFNLNGTFIDNQISTNVIQLPPQLIIGTDPITGKKDTTTKNVNETNYININGSHAYVGRYNIAKQLDDRRYNLELNGNITYGYNNAMSNNVEYHTTNWRFDQRFGPRITPNDNIEFNPYVAYDVNRQFTNLPGSNSTTVKTTSLAVDGRVYFLKTFQMHYDASQSFVTGLTGLTNTNPLIINMGFQKEFFSKRQLTITFDIFDLLHQNNALQQVLNANGGYTNTQSNTLSRYFLVGAILNLQRWSGKPSRKGHELKRRGDGSFIY